MDRFIPIVLDALNMDAGDSLTAETELEGLDGWDSLGKFMLLSSIFTDYEVTLDAGDVERARTVGDLWELLCRARQDQGAQS